MFSPEGINNLRAFVIEVFAFFGCQSQRIKIIAHDFASRTLCPFAFFAIRAFASVKRHDLGFYFPFDVIKQFVHFIQIDISQFVFYNQPGNRVEIVACHLHAEPRTFYQCGTATHENVSHFQFSECLVVLVIGVVVVPNQFGRFGWFIGRFGGSCNQHRAEHAGAATRPPLTHLVNWLARITFYLRNLVDWQNREINLKAG